jgi:DNA-binding transcriptional ArsR family regulator
MVRAIDIAEVGGLLADPSRSTMLQALMDQRARTTGELARLARVAPSTASEHLSRLTDGRLLTVEAQGRHRYYRLADPKVAELLESVMALTPQPLTSRAPRVGFDLRFARTCYDHLAGTVATAIYDQLTAEATLIAGPAGIDLSPDGATRLQSLGIDTEALRRGRRPLARACLDWTERRHHLAGALGAALLSTFHEQNWIKPRCEPRALRLTPAGQRALAEHFAVDTARLVTQTNAA